jgi:hypothetical protein
LAFGQPKHFGSSVKCAFESRTFDSNNWQCQTANELRDIMDWTDRDDLRAASVGVIRIPEYGAEDNETDNIQQGYLVATWYKDRGTTGQMWVMWDDEPPELLTLDTAEFILASAANGELAST